MSGEELIYHIKEGEQIIRGEIMEKETKLPQHFKEKTTSLLPPSFTIIEMS
jgi:hypothetical protein